MFLLVLFIHQQELVWIRHETQAINASMKHCVPAFRAFAAAAAIWVTIWNDSFGPARTDVEKMETRTKLMFGFRLSLKPFFLSLGPCSGPQSCTSFNAWTTSRQSRTPQNIGFVSIAAGWDGFWVFLSCPSFFRGAFWSSSDVSFTKTMNSLPSPECSLRTTSTASSKLRTAWHISIHCLQRPGERYGVRIRRVFFAESAPPKGVKIHETELGFSDPTSSQCEASSQHNNYISIVNYHTISVSSPFWNWGPLWLHFHCWLTKWGHLWGVLSILRFRFMWACTPFTGFLTK